MVLLNLRFWLATLIDITTAIHRTMEWTPRKPPLITSTYKIFFSHVALIYSLSFCQLVAWKLLLLVYYLLTT